MLCCLIYFLHILNVGLVSNNILTNSFHPEVTEMKKTVICIVSTAAAFVLATALNIQNMIWGDTPSVLGFVFSLVFCASLFVLPVVAKNRAFAVVSACFAAFSAIASTVGLLAVKGIISDTVALVAVPPLTAFYGLSRS